jgi:AcrR family transcriptional regulator
LLPEIARAFAELGFRRTTTAELASRCAVQEVVLYRLWPDKKAMFIAAIEHVYDASRAAWEELLAATGRHGEWGLYRLVFAGLSELDDDQVRAALRRMYLRYHEFIVRRLDEHRGGGADGAPAELAAWALIGMGTVTSIGRELGLLGPAHRKRLWDHVGPLLLGRRQR